MERLIDSNYDYLPVTGRKAQCGLRIFQDSGQTLVILTELADSSGMSVTNASEEVATQVRASFDLDTEITRWVEHYPERQHRLGDTIEVVPETFDEVIYEWSTGRATNPTWRRLAPDEVQALLGDVES